MKSVANYISISRIVLAFAMAFAKPLSIVFFVIYILCGISDALDGYIARKTNTTSKLGDNLDSAADFIVVVVLMIALYPIIKLASLMITWIVVIGIIRVVSVIVVFIKYKTFEMLHTYGNKITGFVLVTFPLSLIFVQSDMMIYIICMLASISAIEELFINILSKELRINKKSIFLKVNRKSRY